MDRRIKELIDFTKVKFGLDKYYLQRHKLYRNVNIFNKTVYTLCMEWFPNHVTEYEDEDEDSNPEGTAVIDMDVNSHKFESVIFVGGKSYANGITFRDFNTKNIIKWMEQETGLTYGKQFQLHKEEEREFQFKECIDGVSVFPSGSIEIRFDQEGKFTLFAVNGQFPSYEQERLFPVYAVEEIYVTNDKMSTIPFEFIVDVRSHLKVDTKQFIGMHHSINHLKDKRFICLRMYQLTKHFHASHLLIHFP